MFKVVSFFFGLIMWVYKIWSRIYQFIYDRKYKKFKFKTDLTPQQAQMYLDILEWRPDRLRELFDAFHHPCFVTYAITSILDAHKVNHYKFDPKTITKGKGQPKGSLDCDDFAIWAAYHIDKKFRPRILTVVWDNLSGHNVCLVWDEGYFCVSNAGMSPKYKNLEDLIDWVSVSVGHSPRQRRIYRINPYEEFLGW